MERMGSQREMGQPTGENCHEFCSGEKLKIQCMLDITTGQINGYGCVCGFSF